MDQDGFEKLHGASQTIHVWSGYFDGWGHVHGVTLWHLFQSNMAPLTV